MKPKRRAGIVLVGLGLALVLSALLLVGYNARENGQASQAAQSAMEELQLMLETAPEPTAEIPAETVLAAPQETLAAGEATEEAQETQEVPPLPTAKIDGHDYVGYLEIPSLDRKLPVIQLQYIEDLQIAPCLQNGSPYGDDAVIAAHNYPAHFGPLRDFTGGEEIDFTDMQGQTIRYSVAEVKTIAPTAVEEVMESDYDLVLYTCTTGGQSRVMLGCDRIPEA